MRPIILVSALLLLAFAPAAQAHPIGGEGCVSVATDPPGAGTNLDSCLHPSGDSNVRGGEGCVAVETDPPGVGTHLDSCIGSI
jgi:hypothetical protein